MKNLNIFKTLSISGILILSSCSSETTYDKIQGVWNAAEIWEDECCDLIQETGWEVDLTFNECSSSSCKLDIKFLTNGIVGSAGYALSDYFGSDDQYVVYNTDSTTATLSNEYFINEDGNKLTLIELHDNSQWVYDILALDENTLHFELEGSSGSKASEFLLTKN